MFLRSKYASDSVIREFKSLYPSHQNLRKNLRFFTFYGIFNKRRKRLNLPQNGETFGESFRSIFCFLNSFLIDFTDKIFFVFLILLSAWGKFYLCRTRIIRTLQKRRNLRAFLQILERCTYSTTVLAFATNHRKYRRFCCKQV